MRDYTHRARVLMNESEIMAKMVKITQPILHEAVRRMSATTWSFCLKVIISYSARGASSTHSFYLTLSLKYSYVVPLCMSRFLYPHFYCCVMSM